MQPATAPESVTQDSWFYQDANGTKQGPFSTEQMRAYIIYYPGYLRDTTPVARAPSQCFLPLRDLWTQSALRFTVEPDGAVARGGEARDTESGDGGADAIANSFIGPVGPPRGFKRQRAASPPDDAFSAPKFIDVRTASLEDLYLDRLGEPAELNPWPPPPRHFQQVERVDGKWVNTLDGLCLHGDVLTAGEQRHVLKFVQRLRELGAQGRLAGRTYTACVIRALDPRSGCTALTRITLCSPLLLLCAAAVRCRCALPLEQHQQRLVAVPWYY